MRIVCNIGSEWHTSHHTKGFIFVFVPPSGEEHIYKSPVAKLIRKEVPELVGNKGRHGSWTQYTFEVPEGTILKYFSTGSDISASGYFKINPESPLILVSGSDYSGRGCWLEGQLEWLSPQDFPIDPRFVAHFDKGNLTIEEIARV